MTKQVDTKKYLEFVEGVTSDESLHYAALLSRSNIRGIITKNDNLHFVVL